MENKREDRKTNNTVVHAQNYNASYYIIDRAIQV